jgi:hypothetical protein
MPSASVAIAQFTKFPIGREQPLRGRLKNFPSTWFWIIFSNFYFEGWKRIVRPIPTNPRFYATRTSLTNTRTNTRTSGQPETTLYQALTQEAHQAHQFWGVLLTFVNIEIYFFLFFFFVIVFHFL